MTTLFDGMAGTLNDVFGEPVTIYPGGGAAVEITGVIRDREIAVADDHGEAVLATVTTLRALKQDVVALMSEDRVDGNGVQYAVRYRVPAPSPADDRFETFVLRVQ